MDIRKHRVRNTELGSLDQAVNLSVVLCGVGVIYRKIYAVIKRERKIFRLFFLKVKSTSSPKFISRSLRLVSSFSMVVTSVIGGAAQEPCRCRFVLLLFDRLVILILTCGKDRSEM